MNHAITVGDILRALGGIIGDAALLGLLMIFAGGMSDAPEDGDKTSRQGCFVAVLGLVAIAAMLAACAHAPAVEEKTVEVDKPVAVQPIRPDQVPAPPAPLPPRPSSLSAAADALLSKVCELEGYVLKADPLLRLSAGEKPATLPPYPECEGR